MKFNRQIVPAANCWWQKWLVILTWFCVKGSKIVRVTKVVTGNITNRFGNERCALLKRLRSKKDDFLSRLVTVDETWVHSYEPENKAQSRQWVGPGSPLPKKFKTQPSAGRVMATVFWDAQDLIMLDFLAKKSTTTGAYYAKLLDQLRTAIRDKTPR